MTEDCHRCDRPAECADAGAGQINGHIIDRLIICQECLELSLQDHRQFWDVGWKRYAEPAR